MYDLWQVSVRNKTGSYDKIKSLDPVSHVIWSVTRLKLIRHWVFGSEDYQLEYASSLNNHCSLSQWYPGRLVVQIIWNYLTIQKLFEIFSNKIQCLSKPWKIIVHSSGEIITSFEWKSCEAETLIHVEMVSSYSLPYVEDRTADSYGVSWMT